MTNSNAADGPPSESEAVARDQGAAGKEPEQASISPCLPDSTAEGGLADRLEGCQGPNLMEGAQELLDDIVNMVHDYTADGYDAIEEFVKQLPATSENLTMIQQTIQALYLSAFKQLGENLGSFEERAKASCLRMPLVEGQHTESSAKLSISYSQQLEDDVDIRLANLRRDIALTDASCKQMNRDIRQMDKQLAESGSQHKELASVVLDMDVEELRLGASGLAEYAARLRPLLRKANRFCTGNDIADCDSFKTTKTSHERVTVAQLSSLRELLEH